MLSLQSQFYRWAYSSRFNHLTEVWNPEGFALIPADKMPRGMVAGTSPVNGDVWVGDRYADRFETILYESLHRATHLGRKMNSTPSLKAQLAVAYGFNVVGKGKIEPTDPSFLSGVDGDERNDVLVFWNEAINEDRAKLEEGLIEWAAQRTHGMKVDNESEITIRPEFRIYSEQVKAIEAFKEKLQQHSHFTPEQADAFLISAALTGDIRELPKAVGGDYMVSAILRNTPSAYEGRIEKFITFRPHYILLRIYSSKPQK